MAEKYVFKKAIKQTVADKYISGPIQRFISNSTTSGILLFFSAGVALIIANSPLAESYHHFWEKKLSIGFGDHLFSKTLHHWVNDGLMAVFFFVIGLELKREIIGGELRDIKKAMVPVAAALGGMILPATIYLLFNLNTEFNNGWGVPMATDIAFALGIIYLLGDKVPSIVKVFITALAIVDDLGAVLVIAFFYTSDLNLQSLGVGFLILAIMVTGNLIGIRNTLFYSILGIGGLWLAFLMSGVHATIAAVLAAFVIPANAKVGEKEYSAGLNDLLDRFKKEKGNDMQTLTNAQFYLLEDVRSYSKEAMTPLQNLEYKMHPLVAFVIMPVFALANAGVKIDSNALSYLSHPVFLGVFFGLIAGKVIGIYSFVKTGLLFRWFSLPDGMTSKHVLACGFLGAIGFTMSLFIVELAFADKSIAVIAKLGVLSATLVSSIVAYALLRNISKVN